MSAEPRSMLEVWTRRGINAASVATSFGFYTARKSTQIGFGIARGVTSTVLTIGSTLLSPITPLPPGAGIVLASTITGSLNLMEQLALLPLDIGQAITSTSITLASSSVDVLTSMFGTNEASFSLAEFVTLVRREWNDPILKERLPADKEKYGVLGIGRALIAWAALQCATRGWHEDRWRANMREITNEEWTETTPPPSMPKDMDEAERRSYYNSFSYRRRKASMASRNSRVFVREDLVLPDQGGHIISAEIGEKWDVAAFGQSPELDEPAPQPKLGDIRLNFRRLSKMVLGGYGGASLIFFGIPYPQKDTPEKLDDSSVSQTASSTRVRRTGEADPSKNSKEKGKSGLKRVQDASNEEDVLAQLVKDAEEQEATAGPSNLITHSRVGSTASSRFDPHETYAQTYSMRTGNRLATAYRYPNSPGSRPNSAPRATLTTGSPVMPGVVPFPTVSTTNLHVPPGPSTLHQRTTSMASMVSVGSSIHSSPTTPTGNGPNIDQVPSSASPSWWEILTGKRDQEIFEGFAAAANAASDIREGAREAKKEFERERKVIATIGAIEKMPRFWVLTDHARRQIVLILRGTMSLNELAVDLTCEPMDFEPHTSKRIRRISTASMRSPFMVHGGMYRMAKMMGDNGKPVHSAVRAALRRNRGYELLLSGHSLGASVAGILALMWADPTTCLTVPASGLPVGRRVSVYCIAPPCFTSAELSRLCSPMITSFVYSHDVVSRLSLGSLRDLSRACWWLSDGKGEESCTSVIKKSWGVEVTSGLRWWGKKQKQESQTEQDRDFLLSLRKTLEANMHMTDLYPAGSVFWAVHENDIDPAALPSSAVNSTVASSKLKLFQVERVEDVFDQIVFARDMLSSHMPHNYDRMLHEYL